MSEKIQRAHRKLLAELSNVLSARTHEAAADSVSLRDAVCAYVAVEHSRGTPLASVVAAVKDILRKAEAQAAQASDALAQQLIDWCHEFHPGTTGRKTIPAPGVS